MDKDKKKHLALMVKRVKSRISASVVTGAPVASNVCWRTDPTEPGPGGGDACRTNYNGSCTSQQWR
jgi:hypothetical protein